ncbi:protein nanos [Drosophila miranda]|uniref:protein nanos n=1 Tax=Drosophila miranda TaxID=7229 RepID=UPI0007E66E98|nr:protein nanos [Drosophila miranda]
MFRSSLEGNATNDNYAAFHSRGGLNLLGLQDVYLDTASTLGSGSSSLPPTPSVSSGTLSPPSTPLTPEPPQYGSQTQFPLLTGNSNMNMNMNMGLHTGQNMLLHQHYQYHLIIHQQQQQLELANHHLALAASAAASGVNHQQKDEIARSLKVFAQLTSGPAENVPGSTQDVMQEFASNGYASDDLNCFAYSPAPSPANQLHRNLPAAGAAANHPPQVVPAPAPLSARWLQNYREQLNNVWRSMGYMPCIGTNANAGLQMHAQVQAASNNLSAMGLGLPLQPDHFRHGSNPSNNNNKMNRRYKPKEVSRHCVFCENNNEPEAVVNSHSVRDNFNRVLCPKLRTYVCPICGASGDSAHTIKYCPKKPIITMEDAINAETFRLARSSYYKQQMKV